MPVHNSRALGLTGWRVGERQGPFSIFGRYDVVAGSERPNPTIDRGHIASMITGHTRNSGNRSSNHGCACPLRGSVAYAQPIGTFRQLVVDEQGNVRVVADQQLEVTVHAVTAWGGSLHYRATYMSEALERWPPLICSLWARDHMYFLDALYVIPISWSGDRSTVARLAFRSTALRRWGLGLGRRIRSTDAQYRSAARDWPASD